MVLQVYPRSDVTLSVTAEVKDLHTTYLKKIFEKGNSLSTKKGFSLKFSSKLQAGSLCALSATDKSVDLLGNKNKVT